MHLFSGDVAPEYTQVVPNLLTASAGDHAEERISSLETQIASLRSEIAELRRELADFKQQF